MAETEARVDSPETKGAKRDVSLVPHWPGVKGRTNLH